MYVDGKRWIDVARLPIEGRQAWLRVVVAKLAELYVGPYIYSLVDLYTYLA
jgi:hypothetical protein